MAVNLDSISARAALPAGVSHTARVGRGLALIYRRSANGEAGIWRVRKAVPASVAVAGYRFGILGPTDDLGEGTGLSHREAVAAAVAWEAAAGKPINGGGCPRCSQALAEPLVEIEVEPEDGADAKKRRTTTIHQKCFTVADAADAYFRWFREHRRSYEETRRPYDNHVHEALGSVPVVELTAPRLRAWHEALAAAPALLRGRRGDPNRSTRVARTKEQKAARRNTANGVLGILKAILNRAFEDGRVPSKEAWSRVKPFRDATPPKPGWLTADEAARLIAAAEPPAFRDFLTGALVTGARRGELAGLLVGDYHRRSGSVIVREEIAKTGKERTVPLTDEGVALFDRLTAGRGAEEPLFRRPDGRPWAVADHHHPLGEAYRRAGIERFARGLDDDAPDGERRPRKLNWYTLRHSYIGHLKAAGVPSATIAKAAGNSPAMVDQVYGDPKDDHVSEQVRRHLPRFAAAEQPPATVTPIRARRRRAG